jgi:site-specific recombinase XerD
MWSDIDFENGIITVQRAAAAGEDGEIIKGTKTDRVRYIGINAPLDEVLRKLPHTGLYVLTNDTGDRLSCNAFYNRYEYIFDRMHKAGVDVEFLSPHKCRHTYATYMLAGGANIRAVQAALGHSIVTTTEIYTHVDTEEIKNNIAKLKY